MSRISSYLNLILKWFKWGHSKKINLKTITYSAPIILGGCTDLNTDNSLMITLLEATSN